MQIESLKTPKEGEHVAQHTATNLLADTDFDLAAYHRSSRGNSRGNRQESEKVDHYIGDPSGEYDKKMGIYQCHTINGLLSCAW